MSHRIIDTDIAQPFKFYIGAEPILLNFPHSGRLYPSYQFKNSEYTSQDLRIFEDPYLDILLPNIKINNVSLLAQQYARALIDVNRALHNPENKPIINGEAMGLIPTFLPSGKSLYQQYLPVKEVKARIMHYYTPYHAQLHQMIKQIKHKVSTLLMIDCHSMPSVGGKYDPDAFMRRPDIIISDNFGSSASQEIVNQIEQSFREVGLTTFRNYPYSGGYIISHYGQKKHQIHAVQIEINRRLYLCEETYQLHENAKNLQYGFNYMLNKIKLFLGL